MKALKIVEKYGKSKNMYEYYAYNQNCTSNVEKQC